MKEKNRFLPRSSPFGSVKDPGRIRRYTIVNRFQEKGEMTNVDA